MFKPSACDLCPHYANPAYHAAVGSGRNGVLLLGPEDLYGRAGGMLAKLIGHAGLQRDEFTLAPVIRCDPPDDARLHSAMSACTTRHTLPMIDTTRPKVIVPMGPLALASVLGGRTDVLEARGYVWPTARGLVYPTVSPSFILMGNGEYGTVFIHDLQRAVELARDGWQPAPTHYTLDPAPMHAMQWADEYLAALAHDQAIRLAFDIETAWGDRKDEDKEDGSAGDDTDRSWIITRVGFSWRPHHAISVPWRGDYMAFISHVLGTAGAKVVWNEGFDVPRIRAAGVAIHGPVYDGMVAWHVLQSDLRKKLSFVASMVLDDQPAWKHLSAAMPAFYNACDADIEGRCVTTIFRRLVDAGLWPIYDRHILQLTPLLSRLSTRGMLIDPDRREQYARQLATEQARLMAAMVAVVPDDARKVHHVYATDKVPLCKPVEALHLRSRPCTRTVPVCATCGTPRPPKSHFRTFKRSTAKRPQNPCSGGQTTMQQVAGTEHYRLSPWTPSTDQMFRYCQYRGHTAPKRRDGTHWKVSFDADGIARQALKYPADELYPLVLAYRQIDKLAGTYVGRPSEDI